jgi:hypothetical protein
MRAHFEREAGAESAWTGYNASLGRSLLNTEKLLQKGKDAAPGQDESVAAAAGAASSAPADLSAAERPDPLPAPEIFDDRL